MPLAGDLPGDLFSAQLFEREAAAPVPEGATRAGPTAALTACRT